MSQDELEYCHVLVNQDTNVILAVYESAAKAETEASRKTEDSRQKALASMQSYVRGYKYKVINVPYVPRGEKK